jgi:acetyltransferase-like isoleucine patch superfamily enzyme
LKYISLLLSLFPSFINVPIRKLLGAKIGVESKISLGALIFSKNIVLGNNVKIGAFSIIISDEFTVDDQTIIKPFSIIISRIVKLGQYVHISPFTFIIGTLAEKSIFTVGDHSRFFPFCWIEPGEGIEIGKNVGIGGHTLIFTHGVWPDFLEGAPISYGSVKIGDNVWLPWRVFIMPNIEIGANTIIGANSLVNKNVPENVIAAGSPAKVVNECAIKLLSYQEKKERTIKILDDYLSYLTFKYKINPFIDNEDLVIESSKIIIDRIAEAKKGDLVFIIDNELKPNYQELFVKGISYIDHKNMTIKLTSENFYFTEFISFLRKYGIRLYIN